MADNPYEINRDLNALAPFVRERLVLSLAECKENGYPVELFEGYRTPNRQLLLFSQGRTRPGKIVTTKGPWRSPHNYGLANDVCFYINEDWSWEGPFDKIANIFQSHGFRWLYPFEECHFEIAGGITMKDCETIVKAHDLPYLWDLILEKIK